MNHVTTETEMNVYKGIGYTRVLCYHLLLCYERSNFLINVQLYINAPNHIQTSHAQHKALLFRIISHVQSQLSLIDTVALVSPRQRRTRVKPSTSE